MTISECTSIVIVMSSVRKNEIYTAPLSFLFEIVWWFYCWELSDLLSVNVVNVGSSYDTPPLLETQSERKVNV